MFSKCDQMFHWDVFQGNADLSRPKERSKFVTNWSRHFIRFVEKEKGALQVQQKSNFFFVKKIILVELKRRGGVSRLFEIIPEKKIFQEKGFKSRLNKLGYLFAHLFKM